MRDRTNPHIPTNYKEAVEGMVYEVGKLGDQLMPFVEELGDHLEIEGSKCVITIKPKEDRWADKSR